MSKDRNTQTESVDTFLRACKGMLPEQAFDPEVSLETMFATTFHLMKMLMKTSRTFFPESDYNELLFSLAILESGHETCQLTKEPISSLIFVQAISGTFMNKIKVLCKLAVKKLHLDYTSGEFVTQNWLAMLEEVKEFKRELIRKKLRADGHSITKK
jgi:hypothetical protein